MAQPDDIAIIGMSGIFPGAPDVPTYWSNILAKVEAIREAPEAWIGDPSIFDPDCPPESQKIYTKLGGFLGELAGFDPRPFGTMPVALSGSEPDQFLAMRGAADALKDAGYANRDFDRQRTGIILGHGIHPHRANVNGMQHCMAVNQTLGILRALLPDLPAEVCAELEAAMRAKLPAFNVDTLPGLVPNMMTGRIANRLDLMGPNFIVDGACASSVLAVDAAVTELRRGRADMMLAGGVNTSTSVLVQIIFCKIGALSRRGKVRPFDRSADGTLLGEGQGIVVLKRLEDALRDEDRIYAVIKGIGAASDGRAMGLMAPRFEGEQLAMRRAYDASGLDPDSVSLVEAHATGIPLGDGIEIRALTSIFGERRGAAPHVALGSVKSMIGHCIPASGMASLIKMALSLDQKILPPTLADECNPELGFEGTPFYLNTEALPWVWAKGRPRRAALDAFGFGGINTHMILEEAPACSSVPTGAFLPQRHGTPELFVLATDTREELVAAVHALMTGAEAHKGPLRALAAETARRHPSGPFRLAAVADSASVLRDKLAGVVEKIGRPETHRLKSRRNVYFSDAPIGGKVAFLFPGENSQSPGMLRELATASPLVRDWLDWLEGVFPNERDYSHRQVLYPPSLGPTEAERDALEAALRRVDFGSEAVFTADMAFFTLLHALGVRADVMAGHSTGENAALFASGLVRVTQDSLVDIVRRMNGVFRDVHGRADVPTGTLLTVGALPREAIDAVLAHYLDVRLTMDNCPNQVILFGATPRMDELRALFAAKGAVCTDLPMSWAYHTPFVAPMADAFAKILGPDLIDRPIAQVYSCASAGPFPEEPDAIRALMHAQYVSPVRFSDTVRRLYDDGVRVFVEVGPGGVLTGFVGDILREKPHLALAADSRRGSRLEHFLGVIGQLFLHEIPVDVAPLHAIAGATPSPVLLPPLESALPFIRLTEAEAARLRREIGRRDPAWMPSATPTDLPLEGAGALPGADGDLLVAEAPVAALTRPEIDVDAWTGYLPLAFPSAVEFVALRTDRHAALDASSFPELTETDLAHFATELASANPKRQRDWLAGRLALRRALSAWGAEPGAAAAHNLIIGYDPEGRPIVPDAAVHISVSHKDGMAAAVVSDRPVGIDLERFSAIRDPRLLLGTAFSDAEGARLTEAGWAQGQEIAGAWAAKEAAAKALGRKLLGHELGFEILAVEPESGHVRLRTDAGIVSAVATGDGDYVCVVATPE